MKFLTLLLSLFDRLWTAWNESKLRQQERAKTIKEMNDAINRQIALGEASIVTPDPERTERLRDSFDRSRK
jgi:bacterioferritin (cytochrome b1)